MTRTERLQLITIHAAKGEDKMALQTWLNASGISRAAFLKAARRGAEIKRKIDAGMTPADAMRTTP